MRILFCNYEYPPLGGGGGVVMAALARGLAKRHEVTVLTSRAPGLPASSIEHGMQVIRANVFFRRQHAVANFPSMFAYLPSGFLRGLALRNDFDIVNTHFVVPSGPLGAALAAWRRIPNVLSVHGGDLFDPSKSSSPHRHAPLRAAVRSLIVRADAVIGQSRDTLRRVSEIYGVQRHVELIPLGIERPPTTSSSRARFGLPQNAFVMVTIGRLIARKATAQLVDVLVGSRIQQAHLMIVGDGPEAEAIREHAARAGVAHRVHLAGQLSDCDKHAALASSDVFVSASQHEGFGLVFLEAMGFGLPIVCYDRGGQTDFLCDGETGCLVRLNDIQAFAAAVARLHADAAARARIALRNLQLVENYFIDACASRYEQVFESAIAARASARSRALSASDPPPH